MGFSESDKLGFLLFLQSVTEAGSQMGKLRRRTRAKSELDIRFGVLICIFSKTWVRLKENKCWSSGRVIFFCVESFYDCLD